jgi:hypothetical protein
MRRLFVMMALASLLQVFVATTADACYCGAARHRCCKPACCTATKTCEEVVYEEKQITLYKTVYEEVVDKVVVDAVKYVPETEYRCVKCPTSQPNEAGCCQPCAPATCAPTATCAPAAPVECMRKVPFTVYRCVCYQKTENRPRVVVKQVPYTVTCCVPKVVCKQVPIDVCAPAAPCCAPSGR